MEMARCNLLGRLARQIKGSVIHSVPRAANRALPPHSGRGRLPLSTRTVWFGARGLVDMGGGRLSGRSTATWAVWRAYLGCWAAQRRAVDTNGNTAMLQAIE